MNRLSSSPTTPCILHRYGVRHAVRSVGLFAACCWLFSFRAYCAPSGFPWAPTGPFGNFGTQQTHGRVRSIQVLSTVGDYYVYIGAMGGGLWRASGSVGPEWQSVGENLPNPSVGAFVVHPLNSDDILVGSGDYNRFQGTGMFHTTDGGLTWTTISLPCNPTYFFRLEYLFGNLNVVLAASNCGLLRSSSGANGPWSVVLSGLITDLVRHPSDPNTLFCAKATSFAGGDGGIYKSTNGGQTWDRITTTGTSPNSYQQARIAICRNQPNTMAFVYEFGGISIGVHKSTDGGVTWTPITPSGDLWPLGQTFHVLAIAIRPDNANEILVGANNICRTKDGGITWAGNTTQGPDNTDTIKPHQDQTQFYFSSLTGDNLMWECNDGGVFRINLDTSNYESWNGTGSGNLNISSVVSMDARGQVRAIGLQDDGAALTGNAGASWTGYTCCDVYDVSVTDTATPTFWYLFGTVVKQPLSGAALDVGDPGGNPYFLLYEPFSSAVFGLTTDQNGLVSLVSRLSSATSTGTWTRELRNLPVGMVAMATSPLNGQSLYLWGNAPGALTVVNKVGGNWNVARSPSIGGGNLITTVAPSPARAGEAWAGLVTLIGSCTSRILLGGQATILHTTDDWQTWTSLSQLPSQAGQVTGIAVTPVNTHQIFVSTDVGVFCTSDGGVSWQPLQNGLPRSVYCTGIRYVQSGHATGFDSLVLATCGRGTFEKALFEIIYVDQRNNSGIENGSRPHPFNTLAEGLNATLDAGTMALNGAIAYLAPPTLNKPMTITAYEFPATLTR